MAILNTESARRFPHGERKEIKRRRGDGIELGATGNWRMTYRERYHFGIERANTGDILDILAPPREKIKDKEKNKADQLSAEVRRSPHKALEIGDQARQENVGNAQFLSEEYRAVYDFFVDLTGGSNVFGNNQKGLFKLSKASEEFINGKFKSTFKAEEMTGSAVNTNKVNRLHEDYFVMRAQDGERLKTLVRGFGGASGFKVIDHRADDDTFFLDIAGLKVAFLCPHEKDYNMAFDKKKATKIETAGDDVEKEEGEDDHE